MPLLRGNDESKMITIKEAREFAQGSREGDLTKLTEESFGNWFVAFDVAITNESQQVAFGDCTMDLVGDRVDNRKLVKAFVLQDAHGLLARSQRRNSKRCVQLEIFNSLIIPPTIKRRFEMMARINKVVANHPIAVHELGHVVADRVRKDDNNAMTFAELVGLDVLNSSPNSCSRGHSTKQTFFANETTCHEDTFFVGSLDPVINDIVIENLGNKVTTNALDLITAENTIQSLMTCKNGTNRIDTNNLTAGKLLFDFTANTTDCSTSPRPCNNSIQFSVTLM